MCFSLFGSKKCISWLLPNPMLGGMPSCPGKEIHAQGLRDHHGLTWTTDGQKTELCCIVHHDFAIARWSSLMCWIQAPLPSCLDCSPVVEGCLASSSCSREITCIWVLLILSLISSFHQLMNLEPRCNPAAPLLGQNWYLPWKCHSLSSLRGGLPLWAAWGQLHSLL